MNENRFCAILYLIMAVTLICAIRRITDDTPVELVQSSMFLSAVGLIMSAIDNWFMIGKDKNKDDK